MINAIAKFWFTYFYLYMISVLRRILKRGNDFLSHGINYSEIHIQSSSAAQMFPPD